MSPTFAELVERVHELDPESKQELMEMIHAWLVEERREEIRCNARLAEIELAQGQTKSGTVAELMADLYGQD